MPTEYGDRFDKSIGESIYQDFISNRTPFNLMPILPDDEVSVYDKLYDIRWVLFCGSCVQARVKIYLEPQSSFDQERRVYWLTCFQRFAIR